jgi:hypothetical protein
MACTDELLNSASAAVSPVFVFCPQGILQDGSHGLPFLLKSPWLVLGGH